MNYEEKRLCKIHELTDRNQCRRCGKSKSNCIKDNDKILTLFSQLLRNYRKDMSIRKMAKKIGISSATLHRIENGKDCDIHTLKKVSIYLNLSCDLLVNLIIGLKE